ncbi:MAG: hypothetical protein ACTHUU_01950 [Brachybacterium sp.]
MALIHPRNLERWQEWRSSRRRLPGIHRAATPRHDVQGFVLHTRRGEGSSHILLGIDTAEGASHSGLPAVLSYLQGSASAVTATGVEIEALSGPEWSHQCIPDPVAGLETLGITALLILGGHHAVGETLHAWARKTVVPAAVLQHDLLTPFAPPLPPDSTLLAWTAQDGAIHRADRDDVEVRVVGSQRLWQASYEARDEAPDLEERPVFRGQLTSFELSRRVTLSAAYSGCRSTEALYQPGPGETDRLSRTAHALLRRRGIEMLDPAIPLGAQHRPVLSVLSADVLESAARGLPAWVHAPRAPGWMHEVWERYGMQRIGREPTPAPPVAADEPARLIAQMLESGT